MITNRKYTFLCILMINPTIYLFPSTLGFKHTKASVYDILGNVYIVFYIKDFTVGEYLKLNNPRL